jgi:hypothetical protein
MFLFGFGTNTLLAIPCKSRELINRIEIYYGLVMNMEYIVKVGLVVLYKDKN